MKTKKKKEKLPTNIPAEISEALGLHCVAKRIVEEYGCRMLMLGLGDASDETIKNKDGHMCVEIGTFCDSWRLVRGGEILLGSKDSKTNEEFDRALSDITFGNLLKVEMIADLDVRTCFSSGIQVEFLCTQGDDEVFHIFLPDNRIIVYSANGWKSGLSDKPWEV